MEDVRCGMRMSGKEGGEREEFPQSLRKEFRNTASLRSPEISSNSCHSSRSRACKCKEEGRRKGYDAKRKVMIQSQTSTNGSGRPSRPPLSLALLSSPAQFNRCQTSQYACKSVSRKPRERNAATYGILVGRLRERTTSAPLRTTQRENRNAPSPPATPPQPRRTAPFCPRPQ